MSKRMSKREIHAKAEIDTNSIGTTYFPFPETTTKIGYSSGESGNTANLRQGDMSGCLYECDTYANDNASIHHDLRHSMSARELDVVENLDHIEVMETNKRDRSVFAFVARDGKRFTVATFDWGKHWEICN